MKKGKETCEGCCIRFATQEHRVKIDGILWHEACVLGAYRDRPNAIVTLRRIIRNGARLMKMPNGGAARIIELNGFAP